MSIAYADARVTQAQPAATRSGPSVAKIAVSGLFLVAAAGSTSAGIPFKEPLPVVRNATPDMIPTAGSLAGEPATDAELVRWLKDESGLTWDQIARIFDVSRRTVHLWANGSRVSAGNAEALHAFAALVRQFAGRSPDDTRNGLLTIGANGLSPIDQFRRSQHDGASNVSGTPFEPDELLGAQADG